MQVLYLRTGAARTCKDKADETVEISGVILSASVKPQPLISV